MDENKIARRIRSLSSNGARIATVYSVDCRYTSYILRFTNSSKFSDLKKRTFLLAHRIDREFVIPNFSLETTSAETIFD